MLLVLLFVGSSYAKNLSCYNGNSTHRWWTLEEAENTTSISNVSCETGTDFCLKTFEYRNREYDHSRRVYYSCDNSHTCFSLGCSNTTKKIWAVNDVIANCCCQGDLCNGEGVTLQMLEKQIIVEKRPLDEISTTTTTRPENSLHSTIKPVSVPWFFKSTVASKTAELTTVKLPSQEETSSTFSTTTPGPILDFTDPENDLIMENINSLYHKIAELAWRQSILFWCLVIFMLLTFSLLICILCLFKTTVKRSRNAVNKHKIVSSYPATLRSYNPDCIPLYD